MADKEKPGRSKTPRQGPLGDIIPGQTDEAEPRIRGGKPPEDVSDRPNVGSVTPDDYPEKGQP